MVYDDLIGEYGDLDDEDGRLIQQSEVACARCRWIIVQDDQINPTDGQLITR